MINELKKMNQRWAKDNQPIIAEVNVASLGKTDEHYNVQFKNGAKTTNVFGPTGLKVNESAIMLIYPGRTKQSVIIGRSYNAFGTMVTLPV